GAKVVLLLSDGYGGDASSARVRDLVSAARRAGVHFYALDESGGARDAPSGLAAGTGGTVTRRATAFASAVAQIGKDAAVPAPAAAPLSRAPTTTAAAAAAATPERPA